MANKCKECGCSCKRCISSDHDVQLHVEIENLKQRLLEKETHIVTMETNFLNEANKFPSGELVAIREELLTWQDKYKRLYEAHRRVQRVNQGLEDKLLKLVDVCETEKGALTKDVAILSHKLAEANYAIKKLTDDNARYKNDVTLAIQFLQCKQSNFVAHKFDTLPSEVQSQVSTYMTYKKKPEERKTLSEMKSIKVPMPTFPPTAMVYSVPKSPKPERREEIDVEAPSVDIVSAAIMAKVLEERQRERAFVKHCDTCTCSKNLKIIYENTFHSIGTQTGTYKDMLCLRCNENIQNSSAGLKVLKNNDLKAHKCPIDSADMPAAVQTIVKVQPNNFLLDRTKSNSHSSSLIDLHQNPKNDSPQSKPNIHPGNAMNTEIKTYQDMSYTNFNDNLKVSTVKSVQHHQLCDQSAPSYELESALEKADSEKNVDKISNKKNFPNNLKGPRYCSMRMQTGTRNILLDNAHNNIAPVLYTRSHKIKHGEVLKTHEIASMVNSLSSNECKINSMVSETSTQNQQRVAEWIQSKMDNIAPVLYTRSHKIKHEEVLKTHAIASIADSFSSNECKINSMVSETSTQNQQRVAEWIQSNIDNEISSSDNSRAESVKNKKYVPIDKVKYAEMEENVKKFLFGESEFLKTVEIGKLKYQNFRDGNSGTSNIDSKRTSSTETDI